MAYAPKHLKSDSTPAPYDKSHVPLHAKKRSFSLSRATHYRKASRKPLLGLAIIFVVVAIAVLGPIHASAPTPTPPTTTLPQSVPTPTLPPIVYHAPSVSAAAITSCSYTSHTSWNLTYTVTLDGGQNWATDSSSNDSDVYTYQMTADTTDFPLTITSVAVSDPFSGHHLALPSPITFTTKTCHR